MKQLLYGRQGRGGDGGLGGRPVDGGDSTGTATTGLMVPKVTNMQSAAARGVMMTVARMVTGGDIIDKDIILAVSQNNESLFFTKAF